jgi:hypothetical protein
MNESQLRVHQIDLKVEKLVKTCGHRELLEAMASDALGVEKLIWLLHVSFEMGSYRVWRSDRLHKNWTFQMISLPLLYESKG